MLICRCTGLRRLLISPGLATFCDLQLALQWQYECLKGRSASSDLQPLRNVCAQRVIRDSEFFPHSVNVSGLTRPDGSDYPPLRHSGAKPPSLSSFDSGFDGAGSGHLETGGGKTCPDEASRPKSPHLHVGEGNVSSISEGLSEEKSLQGPSIHIVPNAHSDSVNFEITVKRSATLPKNPWLSLPVDDLENCYTVIISPSQQRVTKSCDQLTQTSDTSVCDFQDQSTEWSPIHNVLSSTITGGEHGAEISENIPTLLWDSYDLHDLMHDSDSVLAAEVPECEWEIKERQELRAVEETLNRAAGILKEEESVLAQEEILGALLEADNPDRLWPSWDKDCEFTRMTSSDLAEAGVIGLEDASLNFGSDQDHLNVIQNDINTPSEPGFEPLHLEPDGSQLLKEITNLKVLEEKVVEEKLKISELRCSESEERVSSQSLSEDRKRFREKLEQEKKEVEEMERNLNMEKKSKLKCPSRSRKIVTCSIMGKSSALRKEDEALLMNCRRSAQVLIQPNLEETTNLKLPSDITADNPVQHKCSDPDTSSDSECSNAVADSSFSDHLNMCLNSKDHQNIDSTSISAAKPLVMVDGVGGCDTERKDLVSSVTTLSNPQDLAIGEPKNLSDPVDVREDGCMYLDPSKTLDRTEQKNGDPKVETLLTEEASTPAFDFDPGGPIPLPRTSRLDKPISMVSEENVFDTISQTAFSTDSASSGDPETKEPKNPSCRMLENQNNNNHLHTVDLGLGSENVSAEPVRSECILRAEEQKSDAYCDGPISTPWSSLHETSVPCEAEERNEREVQGVDAFLTTSVCRSPVQRQLQICSREVWIQYLIYFYMNYSLFSVL